MPNQMKLSHVNPILARSRKKCTWSEIFYVKYRTNLPRLAGTTSGTYYLFLENYFSQYSKGILSLLVRKTNVCVPLS